MKDIMQYKEFIGSVRYSAEDELFYGKLEGIDDLVVFEGSSVSELKTAFQEAVEDYLQICEATAKAAFKSHKGTFNVRIAPELHRQLAKRSLERGLSLNQLVEKAISTLLAEPLVTYERQKPKKK